MKRIIVESNFTRLDKWLRAMYGVVSQSLIERSIRNGMLKLNGIKAKASAEVRPGDYLDVHPFFLNSLEQCEKGTIKKEYSTLDKGFISLIENCVIYEDDNIIALNKPFGIPVQSGKGIVKSIDAAMKNINPEFRVVHRLDKNTTGVLIFAKNIETSREFWRLFSNRLVYKKYIALVVGTPSSQSGEIKCFIRSSVRNNEELMLCNDSDGELAITNFKIIGASGGITLLELQPITGRKHQIRSQLAYIGCPILNDGKYGRKSAFVPGVENRYMNLHAFTIEIDLYGRKVHITAEIPISFQDNTPVPLKDILRNTGPR